MIQSFIIIIILMIIFFLIFDIYKSNANHKSINSNLKSNVIHKSKKDENIINNILIKNFLNDEYYVGGGMCSNNVGLRARLYNNFTQDKQNMHNIKKLI